jgi:hypothetical protein
MTNATTKPALFAAGTHRLSHAALVLAVGAAAACVSSYDDGSSAPTSVNESVGATSGAEKNTYDHPNGRQLDPFAAPVTSGADTAALSRLHDCAKLKYPVLGAILTELGVNLNNTAPTSAGALYRTGASALGAASYAARQPHRTTHTTAETQRLFDVFFAASSEIIASLPASQRCKRDGAPTPLFDAQGKCQAEGLSCLLGLPAKGQHVELCNTLVGQASTPELGRRIAIASLAASHMYCE